MHALPILTTVALAFAAAWVLGMITHRLGLSPIVGYLLAGIVISPHTPGWSGDPHIAADLAEIGVILLMFGVGLHFHFSDLLAVRNIAVPGAIGQTLVATAAGAGVFALFGWPITTGLILGLAMAVASTVVLMRVLMDSGRLDSPEGHAAVGWLIVEDIITVVVLVLIPAIALSAGVDAAHPPQPADPSLHTVVGPAAAPTPLGWIGSLAWAMVKLALLVVILVFAGSRIVPRLLVWVARLRSRELFTLTVLVLSIAVATGSAFFFGASVALGAFLAGMVVGQSPVSRQAGADLLPLRDSFAVLFFVSVGMLFDPRILWQQPWLVIAGLVIVLLIKPIAAMLIVAVLGYPVRTALTVAIGLAQIGEFSFIVSDLARKLKLIPDDGHYLLVACAIVSITLNPLLFKSIGRFEHALQRWPALWRLLNRRSMKRIAAVNTAPRPHAEADESPLALIVGYGPSGRNADRLLRDAKIRTLVIDLNMDAVSVLRAQGRDAVYGDASQGEILEQAGAQRAAYLILTMPDAASRTEIIAAARLLNPAIKIFARARYAAQQTLLQQFGTVTAAVDEVESSVALARLVLLDLGARPSQIKTEMQRIRREFDSPEPSHPA